MTRVLARSAASLFLLVLLAPSVAAQSATTRQRLALRDGVIAIQVDGVGDLMFYSKTGGSPGSGVFTAPWDGIHGWYLKNDSPKDVVAILELAGFYAIEP